MSNEPCRVFGIVTVLPVPPGRPLDTHRRLSAGGDWQGPTPALAAYGPRSAQRRSQRQRELIGGSGVLRSAASSRCCSSRSGYT
jgi:hypothetical protein